jgi:mannitol/fructose-specific phosphotransferase system IIA component (Ntr-type)
MNFSRIFNKEHVKVGLKFKERDDALRKIAQIARNSPYSDSVSEEEIFNALKDRENLCSTGFGQGVAIPHCKLPGIKDFIAGILTVPDGVDFDAVDHKDIRLIVFLIGPQDEINEHIRILALIAKRLNDPEIIDRLVEGNSAEELIHYFENSKRSDLPTHCAHHGHELMQICVQDEDWFNEILQILTGYEDSQVVIIDAEYEGSYLVRIPFFSNVWNDKEHKFCKIIQATVEQSSSGEIIRSIDRLVDGLKDCNRVMITIHPITYMAGSLQL